VVAVIDANAITSSLHLDEHDPVWTVHFDLDRGTAVLSTRQCESVSSRLPSRADNRIVAELHIRQAVDAQRRARHLDFACSQPVLTEIDVSNDSIAVGIYVIQVGATAQIKKWLSCRRRPDWEARQRTAKLDGPAECHLDRPLARRGKSQFRGRIIDTDHEWLAF
jgi:hypothetical protein